MALELRFSKRIELTLLKIARLTALLGSVYN
jgi:hypothetical protein